ncbi:general secretion pathway protein GspK [Halomonas eurihalina]|uniref:Type II secretion system protein K n=1 Tax=Halomonas eurihalina TaxID=42566 RepID=A0A5D9DD77_HALER|nr:type II secretion system minor pseudopilin GspK [Halomonas eurihalina]MDR5858038.1 type II secretion system minor pseudopilin GspK [Halomonas eurihalina]TZG41453.1 general secretion pathway protein GspK [Halomonas eurihalina]
MNRPLPSSTRQDGAALLMVLLCLALVSLTLTSLSEQGHRDLARLSELQAQTQADFYAQGAEVIARRALTDAAVRQAGLWWQSLRGRSLSYPTDHGRIHLNVEDLRGCLNLNALAGTGADLARRQLTHYIDHHLQGRPVAGLSTDAFLARLMDWMDSDGVARSGSLDGPDYANDVRAGLGPRTTANTPLADISEINWLAPLDSRRSRRLPEGLCVYPDSGPLTLNLNSLPVERVALLDSLLEGRVPRGGLERLLRSRSAAGYQSVDAVRSALGDPDDFNELARRLTLTPDLLRLHIRIEIGDRQYHYVRLLQAEGVSPWQPRAPAARVRILQRYRGEAPHSPFPTSFPEEAS